MEISLMILVKGGFFRQASFLGHTAPDAAVVPNSDGQDASRVLLHFRTR